MWGSQDLGVLCKHFFSEGERKLARELSVVPLRSQAKSLQHTGTLVIRHSVARSSAGESSGRGTLLGQQSSVLPEALPIPTLPAAPGQASEWSYESPPWVEVTWSLSLMQSLNPPILKLMPLSSQHFSRQGSFISALHDHNAAGHSERVRLKGLCMQEHECQEPSASQSAQNGPMGRFAPALGGSTQSATRKFSKELAVGWTDGCAQGLWTAPWLALHPLHAHPRVTNPLHPVIKPSLKQAFGPRRASLLPLLTNEPLLLCPVANHHILREVLQQEKWFLSYC